MRLTRNVWLVIHSMVNLLFLPTYILLHVIMGKLIDLTTGGHVGVRQDVLLFGFKKG